MNNKQEEMEETNMPLVGTTEMFKKACLDVENRKV